MNKEQIAFEKHLLNELDNRFKGYDNTALLAKTENGSYVFFQDKWEDFQRGCQARAALDKQDSLEIVKEIERVLSPYDLAAPVTTDWIVLLTKIRKHLTNKE